MAPVKAPSRRTGWPRPIREGAVARRRRAWPSATGVGVALVLLPPHAATARTTGRNSAAPKPARVDLVIWMGSPWDGRSPAGPAPMMRGAGRTGNSTIGSRDARIVRCAPRSNQIRSPRNRSVPGSHGKRMRTSSRTGSPDGGAPAHGPWFVPVSVATSKTPCGPTTISVSANALSGNAPNSSV